MATLRRFGTDDLFKFNNINLDALTETVRAPRGVLPLFSTDA